jgi:hypothetical protein
MSANIEKIYGKPCDTKNHVTITVPFPLIIAWDKTKATKRITVHKLVAKDLENIFKDILKEYVLPKIQELGINLFGGTYNCRNMRGGTNWSMHAYAIAIDLDPERNQLKWGKNKAQFAKPDYKKMIDIFYKYGWESLGREENRDWMHFQKKV